jgi:hypothetical protein
MTLGAFNFLVFLVQLILLGALFWLWFWLTKVAIREGIRESGLVEAIRRGPASGKDADRPDWAQ